MPEASAAGCCGVRTLGTRSAARRQALLDAAARLFVTKGFEKTTLSDLVDVAGGSRASIYELFGDKAGLFRAMMEQTNRRVVEQLASAHAAATGSPDEALVRIASDFLKGILNDEARAVVRVLVAERGRIPDIAEEFWRSGPAATVRQVADYLRALAGHGGLRIDDPEAAAQSFVSLVVGELFMKGLILPGPPVPDAEIERRARGAVRLFLDGIRSPGDDGVQRQKLTDPSAQTRLPSAQVAPDRSAR